MTTITHSEDRRKWLGLVGFVIACTIAAALGAVGVSGTAAEYQRLDQPAWAPPSWLFGPVWTVLYATIAFAGWMAWRRAGWGREVWWYTAQLVLNAVWTPLFFGAGMYGLAFAEIVLLWLAIGMTIREFRGVSTTAAALMVPYWAWVTFAAALNLEIWRLNG